MQWMHKFATNPGPVLAGFAFQGYSRQNLAVPAIVVTEVRIDQYEPLPHWQYLHWNLFHTMRSPRGMCSDCIEETLFSLQKRRQRA